MVNRNSSLVACRSLLEKKKNILSLSVKDTRYWQRVTRNEIRWQKGTVLMYLLAMKLGTFWAAGEAEREKIVRISFFCGKNNLHAYLKTRGDRIVQSSTLLECLKKDLLSYVQGEKISFINYPLKIDNFSSFFIRNTSG